MRVAAFPGTFPCLSDRELMGPDRGGGGTSKSSIKRHNFFFFFYSRDVSCLSRENFAKDSSSNKRQRFFSILFHVAQIHLVA